MRIFPFFNFEKGLFLPYLHFKLWYVDLVVAIDVHFESFDFSNPLHPLDHSLKNVVFFVNFSQVFSFVLA